MPRRALLIPLAVAALTAALTQTAAAATAPGPPASCSATVATGGVDVEWTAPASGGGTAVTRYAVKVKGQASPVVQVNDGTALSYLWTTSYAATSVFQVRAVNAAGFGTWCETPVTAAVTPPPPPVGANADYEPGSWLYSTPGAVDQAATSAMQAFISSAWTTSYPLLNGLGTNKWGMVHADGTATDPVWHLTGTVPAAVAGQLGTSGPGFHAPAWLGDVLTGTSDSPFVVDDQASGISVWGAKAVKGSGYTISVGSAGYFAHGTNGLDGRAPGSDGARNYVSRGRIPDTMVITKAQMDAAEQSGTDLGHVLEMFWNETNSAAGYRLPMVGAEAGHTGWGAEGQRIAVSATVDLAARSCTPEALAIAKTLQHYGAYLGDNAGTATALKMEQDSTAHPVWGGTVAQNELAGCLTWADFVATN